MTAVSCSARVACERTKEPINVIGRHLYGSGETTQTKSAGIPPLSAFSLVIVIQDCLDTSDRLSKEESHRGHSTPTPDVCADLLCAYELHSPTFSVLGLCNMKVSRGDCYGPVPVTAPLTRVSKLRL